MYKMLIVEDDPMIADEVAAQIAPWGIEAKKSRRPAKRDAGFCEVSAAYRSA